MQNLNTPPFPPPLSTPPPVNVAGGGEGVLLSPSYSPPAQPFVRAPGVLVDVAGGLLAN